MKAYLIIDGMWGSCGKGSLAGKLALDRKPDLVLCNFGPNAGHTFKANSPGVMTCEMMTQQLPTGIVSPGLEFAILGPGSIVDPEIFLAEMERYGRGLAHKIGIHENASVVTANDREVERMFLGAIGSTKKGTAAASMRKILRAGPPPRRACECESLHPFLVDVKTYDRIVENAKKIQIESAQGIELSLSRGLFYPYCTGRDVTPEQVLNDVGVPLRMLGETCLVLRTYPIRVGHEKDGEGKVVGESGPVYPTMEEITWARVSEEAGFEVEERTTVTKKIRRVFRPSEEQIRHALWVAGPSSLFVNFMNYLGKPGEEKPRRYLEWIDKITEEEWGFKEAVRWTGWGPTYADVHDRW